MRTTPTWHDHSPNSVTIVAKRHRTEYRSIRTTREHYSAMSESHCNPGQSFIEPTQTAHPLTRRSFMRKAAMTAGSISALDFLSYFRANGAPLPDKAAGIAHDKA